MTTTDSLTAVAHRDPACTAGFTATLDATVASYDDWRDPKPTRVHLRCWSCDTWVALEAGHVSTDRDDDVEGDLRRARPEARPYLWDGSYGTSLRTLCAAVPPVKVGRVELHAEHRTGWRSLLDDDDVYEWLVTDHDGNVLGAVMRYRGQRGGTLYRCGIIEGGQVGEGFATPTAAAKRVAQAAL